MTAAPEEVRFAFGDNWRRFLSRLTPDRIALAEASFRRMLGRDRLDGVAMLDIGSGSGLSSLAAWRLGATVHSFDYDPASVACTRELQSRYAPRDGRWRVEQGSALDAAYLEALGQFDLVYSWGVLHHTGSMWRAIDLAAARVRPGGMLWLALYNDQGWVSRYWTTVKHTYNSSVTGRAVMTAIHAPYLFGARAMVRKLAARGELERGMDLWYDMHDWLGGMPFEVAQPGAVTARLAPEFTLVRSVEVGQRHGCNELVYARLQR